MRSLRQREKGLIHLFRRLTEERNEELGCWWLSVWGFQQNERGKSYCKGMVNAVRAGRDQLRL